ncbi:MAG: response regulator transcription factor [Proteobacteria bacterium]|nr:response regulator transcription factor [Pseudomonadota bacterium]
MKMRAVLVDDEEPALARLRQLCTEHPDVRVVGEAASGPTAIDQVRRLAPDLLLLDVHLGAMNGLDVLKALEGEELPQVVFMTAYEEYAASAFERDAVDYLLKPCTPERFARALEKVRDRRSLPGAATRAEVLAACRALLANPATGARRDGLFLEDAGRWVFVDLDSIDYIEAARNYVVIHAAGRSYCHRATISSLEHGLDPLRFARIHKSVIVNLNRVESIESDFNGVYVMRIIGGASCRTGQSYRGRIQELLRAPAVRDRAI